MRESDKTRLVNSIDSVATDLKDGVVLFKVSVEEGKLKEISSKIESRKKFLSTLGHSPEDPMSKFSEQFVTTFSTALRRSYPEGIHGPDQIEKGSTKQGTRENSPKDGKSEDTR